MGHLLEIDSDRMQIGDRTILEHAYLQVRSGEVVALLGRNGSGKSTLLQMLYGTRRGTFRHVRWDGQPFERVFEHPESVRYLPQFHFVPGHLSVRRVFADYQVDLASFAADFPDLTNWDIDILCIGKEIVDAGLLDMKLDVLQEEFSWD